MNGLESLLMQTRKEHKSPSLYLKNAGAQPWSFDHGRLLLFGDKLIVPSLLRVAVVLTFVYGYCNTNS